ncbi:MAG: sugar transferase [Deltaproteobacteria bacterium]|nr:sugar transferase [Deltaproteobacteria bacterium]
MDWKARALKRAIDVAGATAGLVITAPLFPLLAAAVRLTSKGPIFYEQVRCGADRRAGVAPPHTVSEQRHDSRGYRTFRMKKFRTMRVDAEAATGAVLAKQNDSRLTPIGGFLRKTRLDELPQLVHVLRGEMSLVGPRPERPELMDKIEVAVPFFHERMRLIKPGITGLAQIKLAYDGSFDGSEESTRHLEEILKDVKIKDDEGDANRIFANKLLYDLAYSAILETPSEWLKTDLEIMLKTPWVMIAGKGR